MFTGLVEEMGSVRRIEERPAGRRLWIAAQRVLADAAVGHSVAVNGCCLTVTDLQPDGFAVEVVPETLRRTTLGHVAAGDPVNLERSLRFDQRLGGHLVQGHVDGLGEVRAVAPEGDGRRITIDLPQELAPFVAEKGSIAIDGISLTVAAVTGSRCEIALVPHTLAVTNAGRWMAGVRVNVEIDLLARYLARLLQQGGIPGGTP
ncbi:MAG: riboflavin synthase [Candidatus Eisenbacteria bacterium]|uniref:Riboflavin synthase n=1 Tax=Eiseniibacteriota bacterium TaxID=2212470 RepID=A0A538U1Q5_UNCEI|nr:MAG: riboflavin synthase [Candidatus Eisenbacteria bacterium]